MSDVLSVVAGACFVDAFIAFVIVSVLLYDKQGQFELRWPWSNSRVGLVEQTARAVRGFEALGYEVLPLRGVQRSLDYATWQEAGGFGWYDASNAHLSEPKHFTMGHIRHKWMKPQ